MDDIHLALDMLNDAWKNEYDKAILISGDGDFTPLVRYVKNKEKKIEVISFEEIISRNLVSEVKKYKFITKKIANKFFLRDKKKKPKKDFFGALKGIGSFTKEDELKGQLKE